MERSKQFDQVADMKGCMVNRFEIPIRKQLAQASDIAESMKVVNLTLIWG